MTRRRKMLDLFAQTLPIDPTGSLLAQWVAVIVQGGAMAILGYHLLVGLPNMLKENAKSQQETVVALMTMFRDTLAEDRKISAERSADDRKAFAERSKAVSDGLSKLSALLPEGMGSHVNELVTELKLQTATINLASKNIEQQSKSSAELAEKVSKWPSDWQKVCKSKDDACNFRDETLQAAMSKAGFDAKLIQRLLELQKKRREHGDHA